MPVVVVRMREGRTTDQKRALVKRITEALAETCNAPTERIIVYIEDIKPENASVGGVLLVDNK